VKNKELLSLLSQYTGVRQDEAQYFASSDSAHETICKTFFNAGDRVVVVGPTYDNFCACAEIHGAKIHYFNLDEEFNFEFYGKTVTPLIHEFNSIITRTFSKAFVLASFQVGYTLSCMRNTEVLSLVCNPKSITMLSQVAAIVALRDVNYMHEYVRSVNYVKKYVEQELAHKFSDKFTFFRGVGNFIFILFRKMDASPLIDFLASNRVFVRSFSHKKELKDFVRITICTKDQMAEVIGGS